MVKFNDKVLLEFKDDFLRSAIKELNAKTEELSSVNKKLDQKEQELTIASKKAEESDNLKCTFLTNISHEIRTPLNGLIGFIQLLETNNLSLNKQTEWFRIIKNNGYSLLNVVDNLIDISKIQTKSMEHCKRYISIDNLFRDLIKSYKNIHEISPDIELILNIPENRSNNELILLDEYKVERTITHLLNNALKFTKKGVVQVGYEMDDKWLLFYVKDTGIGISPEKSDLIFEPFRQVDETITRNFEGLGLGLAISKGFVEFLGGEIWYESILNEGSTFFFSLPLV